MKDIVAVLDAAIVDVEYLLKLGVKSSARAVISSMALEIKAIKAAAPTCRICRSGKVLLINGKKCCDVCG